MLHLEDHKEPFWAGVVPSWRTGGDEFNREDGGKIMNSLRGGKGPD